MCKAALGKALIVFGLLSALSAPAASVGAEWGSLKGRFVLDGAPPKLAPLVITKDAYCVEAKPVNETVVVGENNGLANVVVYLRVGRGKNVEAHPDYAALLNEPVVLDNKGCAIHPHITLVRVGQTLQVNNSDPGVGHNTNIPLLSFNQTVPPEGMKVKVSREGPLPNPVNCNIHPWMQGHILAQDHPYMATTAEDGTFEIKNLPAGKQEFQFWHEKPGYLKNLKLKSGSTDRRGRADLTIAAGQTLDLGDIKVPASILR
jgi:hypothetical protein